MLHLTSLLAISIGHCEVLRETGLVLYNCTMGPFCDAKFDPVLRVKKYLLLSEFEVRVVRYGLIFLFAVTFSTDRENEVIKMFITFPVFK